MNNKISLGKWVTLSVGTRSEYRRTASKENSYFRRFQCDRYSAWDDPFPLHNKRRLYLCLGWRSIRKTRCGERQNLWLLVALKSGLWWKKLPKEGFLSGCLRINAFFGDYWIRGSIHLGLDWKRRFGTGLLETWSGYDDCTKKDNRDWR